MELQTTVQMPEYDFRFSTTDKMLLVGSCFADSIGRKFCQEAFCATVNPDGVMYNPVSVCHCVERHADETPTRVVITLGTNHVYRLRETGEIVDNCEKRPQRLFSEEELTTEECTQWLLKAVDLLAQKRPDVRVLLTVSPIRYAKYGYHGSQLSKATLLLAADRVVKSRSCCAYFPAYEIVNDELRDYRFYAPDMLHPSPQAVDYIWERMADALLSDDARQWLQEWKPVRQALDHRPFDAQSEAYRQFRRQTLEKAARLARRWPQIDLNKILRKCHTQ